MDFANNFKKIRKEKMLSQQKLADMMDIAQSTVGMWETGKRTPPLDEIERISKTLSVTIDRLIGGGQKIEVAENRIYVDGKEVQELDIKDIGEILKHISDLKETKKEKKKSPTLPEKERSKAKKILIIDDEQGMCETLYSYLVPHNYKVFLSFSAQMGLEYFNEIKPDVVLLDLSLPDMDGIEVLRILRKVSNVPVLIITSHPAGVAEIHLVDLHIEGYIEKPFSLEQILNTLKHLLGD